MTPDKVEAALGVLRWLASDNWNGLVPSMPMPEVLSVLTEALGERERDAARYRWLKDSKSCSLTVNLNDHHCMYESVESVLDFQAGDPRADYYADVPADERAKMIATDTIWTVHIYPNTPVGFNVYHAATLDTALDAAIKETP